jgi:hypothetical protein
MHAVVGHRHGIIDLLRYRERIANSTSVDVVLRHPHLLAAIKRVGVVRRRHAVEMASNSPDMPYRIGVIQSGVGITGGEALRLRHEQRDAQRRRVVDIHVSICAPVQKRDS